MIDLTGSTLFIVGSPFQCLCMLEAVNHWDIINYDVFVNTTETNEGMISRLLKEKGIPYLSIRKTHLLKHVLPLAFKKLKRYNNVFVGNYYNLPYQDMALAYCKHNAKIIFLDDGIQAVELFSNNPRKVKNPVWISLVQHFFSIYAFFKRVNRSFFFTIYDVKSEKFIIEKNSFEILKPNNATTNDGVFVIGTNSSKLNLNNQDYREILMLVVSRCKKDYKNQTVFYCPHRGDKNNGELKPLLLKHGVVWFDTEISVEYDFIKKNIYPQIIIGFNSNALFTLHSLFPKSLTMNVCFRFKNDIDNIESNIIRDKLVDYGIPMIEL